MKRSNLPVVGVMVASLLGSVGARSLWQHRMLQAAPLSAQHEQSASSAGQVKKLDSFALGLLLGGLRGPLVMVLWSSSESQKGQRDLADFDTKIELIRLLQPEFDTVHLFQIWNKAYNVSVQVANLSNKYSTILDAIDYANNVLAERPDNINVVAALGGIYFEKLGTSAERDYYRERVRSDTMSPQASVRITLPIDKRAEFAKAALDAGLDSRRYSLRLVDNGTRLSVTVPQQYADLIKSNAVSSAFEASESRQPLPTDRVSASGRRIAMDPMLEANGMIRERLLAPRRERPGTLAATSEPYIDIFDDGSELGFLKPFQPFPQGISPMALAYVEFKKAIYLQEVLQQQHIQINSRVISSRAATVLRTWAEEEIQRGRRFEIEGSGLVVPLDADPPALENIVADMPLSPMTVTPLMQQAIDAYGRVDQLSKAGMAEFQAHISRSPDVRSEFNTYYSAMSWLHITGELAAADADYLRSRVASDADRRALQQSSANHYIEAERQLMIDALRYYVQPLTADMQREFNVPPIPRGELDTLSREQLLTLALAYSALHQSPRGDLVGSEFIEYMTYVQRVVQRLNMLGRAGVTPLENTAGNRPSVLMPQR